MREDDRHIREIDRDVVEQHGLRVLEPDAAPATRRRADAGLPGVEKRRQLGLGDCFVQRVSHAVVGKELLHRRVKLEAPDAEVLDQPPRFAHALCAAMGIDAREGDRDVAVLVGSSAISSLVIFLSSRGPSTVNTTKAIFSLRYICAISGTVWCCGW